MNEDAFYARQTAEWLDYTYGGAPGREDKCAIEESRAEDEYQRRKDDELTEKEI